MPPAGTKLTASVLTKFLRANLILADIEPIFGPCTEITRFALNSHSVKQGDTYIHCSENYSLLKDVMQAYENGANGIICKLREFYGWDQWIGCNANVVDPDGSCGSGWFRICVE